MAPQPQKNARRPLLIAAVVGLLIALSFAPYIVSRTNLRNSLLQALIGESDLVVTSEAASFGWFSPLTIDGIRVSSSDQTFNMTVNRVQAERSWLSLWLNSPDLGRIEFDGPRIDVLLTDDDADRGELHPLPTLTAAITDASLLIREESEAAPVVDARDLQVTIHTAQQGATSVLRVEPIQLADRVPLTAEACEQGLQLIAPVLSDELELEGEYSFELTGVELHFGAGESNESEIRGTVTLHHVTAGLKNEMTRRLAALALELLELGELPERVRLAEDAKLEFRVNDRQVRHEGLALFFPDMLSGLSVRTKGTVAADETLDLQADLNVPVKLLDDSALAKRLAAEPLQLRLAGTIDQPTIEIPQQQTWITELESKRADWSAQERTLVQQITKALDRLRSPDSN